jgi:DNA invertase Pin-like site-specific DNA recombinase/peptidoglycan hydrolase-like protein with peptidoglycan-binding domain
MVRRWPLAALAAALTLMTAPAAFGATGGDPHAAAGWHGREIRDPSAPRVRDAAVARFPRGWSAGSVGVGSGYADPGGSRRVREVQRRLIRRGYRPGRVDGRFGSRTRAAVVWFQVKHGLPRTGRVDARSIATLRRSPEARTPMTAETSPPPSAAQEEARTITGPSLGTADQPAGRPWLLALGAALILVGLVAIAWWLRAELRHRPPVAVERRARLTAAPTPPAHATVAVIGYVGLARGAEGGRALNSGGEIIASWCDGQRWDLAQIVHDVEPASGRLADRPGLAYALDQIAAGHVAGLVLARLGDVTRSVTELARLLRWLNEAGAFMIALDYELDTSTTAGELAAGALMEIGDWERGRIAERTRPGLTAIRTQSATANRAAVRDDPELAARIRAMRDRGMSLRAISDTLNEEGVPTLRGGTHWRPSSVQTVTGYKRPPANGAGGGELPPADDDARSGRWDNER